VCLSLNADAEKIVGYCGLCCGFCRICRGRIRQASEDLRKVIGTYGFDKIALELSDWEPAFQHYTGFEEFFDGIMRIFGDCPGCVAGGGDPNCLIRECCKQKAYITCLECLEMDLCEKLRTITLCQRRFKALTLAMRLCLLAEEASQ